MAAVEEQNLPTVPVPVHHMEIFLPLSPQQGIVETAYSRLCTDKIGTCVWERGVPIGGFAGTTTAGNNMNRPLNEPHTGMDKYLKAFCTNSRKC